MQQGLIKEVGVALIFQRDIALYYKEFNKLSSARILRFLSPGISIQGVSEVYKLNEILTNVNCLPAFGVTLANYFETL